MKTSQQVNSINSQASNFFTVPLTKIAHGYAQKFYQEHSSSAKKKQIYLNTLAVYAVDYYLKCLGITTSLKASDSWNPVAQSLANIADLVVSKRGRLECCPVWSDSDICEVSSDTWTDRIGYVVVWLDSDLTQATLLGFSQSVAAGKLLISKLQPLENLASYLDRLEVNLEVVSHKGWLEKIRQILSSTWQQVEPLLAPSSLENDQLAVGYRSGTVASQIGYLATDIIDFHEGYLVHGMRLNIAIIPQPESAEMDVLVELSGSNLPTDLELIVREATGEIIISAIAQSEDSSICLQFSRQWQETFTLEVFKDKFLYVKNWKPE
jgi:hypothetical protein